MVVKKPILRDVRSKSHVANGTTMAVPRLSVSTPKIANPPIKIINMLYRPKPGNKTHVSVNYVLC